MNRPLATLLASAALAAGAVASAAEPAPPAAGGASVVAATPPGLVDVATARRLVAAGVRVVDVRTPGEFAAGHVPGAVNVPFDELEKRHAEIGPPSAPVLLYCRSGRRSGIAAKTLRSQGFDKVYDFQAYDLWVSSER